MTDILQIVANGGARAMANAETRATFERVVQETLPNARVAFIEEGGDVMQVVKDCIDQGATTVIAAGGDGTVNAVASHVMNSAMTLGVIPMGTLNHFSHDLGIPLEMTDRITQDRNFVHGAGFADYLQNLFVERFTVPLLAFNVGIELGQIVVLAFAAILFALMDRALRGVPVNALARTTPFQVRLVTVSALVTVVATGWAWERLAQ